MAAHRYWRLNVTAVGSGSQIAVTELRFFASSSPASEVLAAGGTASASDVFSGTYSADKAFDGLSTTHWKTNTSQVPGWVKYDFGAGNDQTVAGIILTGLAVASSPKDFTLDYSDDDSAWTTALTVTGETRLTGTNPLLYGVDTAGTLLCQVSSRDMEFGGAYRVTGTTGRQGVACRKRVRLYDRRSGLLVRELWSGTDGAFSFDWIANNAQGYLVIGLDDLSYDPWKDPACADRVTPEAMPG